MNYNKLQVLLLWVVVQYGYSSTFHKEIETATFLAPADPFAVKQRIVVGVPENVDVVDLLDVNIVDVEHSPGGWIHHLFSD